MPRMRGLAKLWSGDSATRKAVSRDLTEMD